MENYVLYEETDRYTNTIVYKGRKKGEISFVSIYCIEKCRRPEVTNRVRLTYEISHKNIVRFYEWYETNNHLWLVVELCSGGTLERIIQQDSHLPEECTLRFASSVAAGLYHCHSLGILFGPLRPSRILLDSVGVFKLADFGTSKLDGESLLDVLKHQFCEEGEDYEMASPDQNDSYRAPELGSSFDWSIPSDLYSFGVMLYHLFTGTLPVQNSPLQWQATEGAKTIRLTPSDNFRDLITGLLVVDPLKRYTWSDILSHPAMGDRLASLANDGQTLLDSETATLSGDEGNNSGQEESDSNNNDDKTPRASVLVTGPSGEETGGTFEGSGTDGKSSVLASGSVIRQQQVGNIDLNANRPPTACGRTGLVTATGQMGKSGTSLMASRPSTAGRLTPCQALDSGPVETRTARTPQHAVMTAVQAAAAVPLLGCGYEPDDTVDWCHLQLFHESDLAVTTIVDNQRIFKTAASTTSTKFDTKLLPVAQTTADKLATMTDRDRIRYVTSLLDNICGVNEKGPISAKRVNHINYCAVLFASSTQASDAFVLLGGPSALLKMIKETNQTVDNKQRLLHLLAVVCSRLSPTGLQEDGKAIAELIGACNTVGEMLRDAYHQRSVRLVILPTFGELVYAVVRSTPVATSADVSTTVPTLILRCLKETDCQVTSHYAAKIIENLMACPRTASANSLLRRFLTSETLQQLWGLFNGCNVDALKISCTLALSRILLHDSALVGPLLDVISLAGILDPLISSQSPRVHQSLITILCVALCRLPKLSSSKEVLDALLFEMEHPSPIVRAKGYLGFCLVVRNNPEMLMYCTQSRLSSYLERDFQKAIQAATKHEYLEHGVASAVSSLAAIPAKLNKQAIEALKHVSLKQHPTTVQTKQLNAALPGIAVVAYLISCSLIRQQVVDAAFIADMVELTNALVDATAAAATSSNVATSSSVMVVVEDLRQGVLAALEATVQSAVGDQLALSQLSYFPLLSPLGRLVTETYDVELQAAGLRLLTDLLPAVFKVEKSIENMRLSDLLRVILPTLERLLLADDPLPTLTASFLLAACQISPKVVRTLSASKQTLGVVVETLDTYKRRPTVLVVQHLLELLDTILAQPQVEFGNFLQPSFIDTLIGLCSALTETAGASGYQVTSNALDTVARPLFATLSVIHNILRHVALSARRAIQARQQGGGSNNAQEAAEEALKAAKGLTGLDSVLVNLLMIDDSDMADTAANILSLLAQLYGPAELAGALTEENVSVWIGALTNASPQQIGTPPPPARAKSLLRTLRRLVQQPDQAPARYTALNSDGLVRAIENLSTIMTLTTTTTTTTSATMATTDTTSIANEAANVSQLAHEIVAALAHNNSHGSGK